MSRKILFLTGTRADFGKMKPLMKKIEEESEMNAYIFITGMHTLEEYGGTYREVEKEGFENTYKYINQRDSTEMDIVLSNTILGLSNYVKQLKPDMIVVHGDRVEALAGAVVGSFNNILVGHVEGGEVSGTIDEPIRHSITKLSHLHFVSTEKAVKRVKQLGEDQQSVYNIGSPDIDIMLSDDLPKIERVKNHYDISFEEYGILIYHPVTTEIEELGGNISRLVDKLIDSNKNYIVIKPNNDKGSKIIQEEYKRLENRSNFEIYPSIRFEFFLTLLKNAQFIIGNSSAGIRESEVYGTPSINIGSRQEGRYESDAIIDIDNSEEQIIEALEKAEEKDVKPKNHFGEGNSAEKFLKILKNENPWQISRQKKFVDRFDL